MVFQTAYLSKRPVSVETGCFFLFPIFKKQCPLVVNINYVCYLEI